MKTKIRVPLFGALILSLLLSFSALANGGTPPLPNDAQVLFVQVAKSGALVAKQNQPNTYSLVLKAVEPFTSYFTDRPNRVTGLLATNNFVSIWQSENDIRKIPPNVAMETSNLKNGNHVNQVLVLSDPVYDAKNHLITYTAKSLNGSQLQPMNLGYTVLFIDNFHWHGNKFG